MGHYMTKEERIILQTLLDEKKPVSYIARKLGCCRQTVYNEIHRGEYLHNYGYYDKLRYSAERGQQKHNYSQTAKGRPLKIGNDHAFAAYIEHKIIVDRYSPAAALASARRHKFETSICVSTLYSYIDKRVFFELGNRHLWEKWKKKPKKENKEHRVVHPKLPSIEIRPEGIGRREEYGHWEMDLVVSGEGTSHADRTTEQTGDHCQAARQAGGDHTLRHRPNGTESVRLPEAVSVNHYRQWQRVHGIRKVKTLLPL